MKLSKKSLLVKWAYLPELIGRKEIPTRTNLCDILWRASFFSPIFVCAALPILCTMMVVLYPVCWLHDVPGQAIEKWWEASVIKAAIMDWKNKTCTKVEIE